MYLTLPIPKNKDYVTIYDCIQEFSKKEENIEFRCDKCKKNRIGSKQLFLYKLPNILIIHLKRFEMSGLGYGFKKIDKNIKYDVNSFNLQNFCANVQKEPPIYDLYGIVHHEGNMAYGHYYSFAKNEDNK